MKVKDAKNLIFLAATSASALLVVPRTAFILLSVSQGQQNLEDHGPM